MANRVNLAFTEVVLVDAAVDATMVTLVSDRSDNDVVMTVVGTKNTGTVAGTVDYEGSIDGTNWYNLAIAQATITDVATQTFTAVIDHRTSSVKKALYYRVKLTGAGTQNSTWNVSYAIIDNDKA